jgi:biotin operon repressor
VRHDPAVTNALGALLLERHQGNAHAATGEVLRQELQAAGLSLHLRRVGESVEALIEQGWPIASLSRLGYWIAREPEELEAALFEVERRAKASLRRRRLLRRQIAELRGQVRMRYAGEGE